MLTLACCEAQRTCRRGVRISIFTLSPCSFPHSFSGLPPTWSSQLASMGFSQEEIAAIQTRRTQRKPTLHALTNDRSASSSPSTPSMTARPAPRSSSLRYGDEDYMSQRSDTSYAADVSSQTLSSADNTLVSLPPVGFSTDNTFVSMPGAGPSVLPPNRVVTRSPDAMSQYTRHTTPSPPPQPGPSRIPQSKDNPPRTPTKRTYHVTNDSLGSIASPPPAYTSG